MLENLNEIRDVFQKIIEEQKQEQDEFWNSLTKDQQLLAFCSVVRRICGGELVDRGSYRYVLYQTFGFGPEAYMAAQEAGYLELHNSIKDPEYDMVLLLKFAKRIGIENPEQVVDQYLHG